MRRIVYTVVNIAAGASIGVKVRAPMPFGGMWLVPFVVEFMSNGLNNVIQEEKLERKNKTKQTKLTIMKMK